MSPRRWGVCISSSNCAIMNEDAEIEVEINSGEEENGFAKPKLGFRNWGTGAPRTAIFLGKEKMFADGFGLCSPGHWAPQHRKSAAEEPKLAFCESLWIKFRKLLASTLDMRNLAFKLVAGHVHESPFSNELLDDIRVSLFTTLRYAGYLAGR